MRYFVMKLGVALFAAWLVVGFISVMAHEPQQDLTRPMLLVQKQLGVCVVESVNARLAVLDLQAENKKLSEFLSATKAEAIALRLELNKKD